MESTHEESEIPNVTQISLKDLALNRPSLERLLNRLTSHKEGTFIPVASFQSSI